MPRGRTRVGWSGVLVLLVLAGPRSATADTTLPVAEERLKALEKLLKRRKSTNADINRAIGEVQQAYHDLVPEDPAGPDEDFVKRTRRFQGRAERAWCKALALADVPRGTKSNRRREVQLRAVAALGTARPEAAEGFMRTLQRKVIGQSDYDPWPPFYDAAFRALAATEGDGVFEWLLERALNADVNENAKHRALAALETMMAMRGLTGGQRREAVRRILAIFQSYAFHWPNKYEAVAGFRTAKRQYYKIAGTAGPYWVEVRPVVLRALRQFSIDPRTTLPPFERRTTDELPSLPRYLNWFATNQRPGLPPWVDIDPENPPRPRARSEGRYAGTSLPELWRMYGVPWEDWWLRHRRFVRPPERTGDPDAAKAREAQAAFRVTLREKVLPGMLPAALESPHEAIRAVAAVTVGKLRRAGAAATLTGLLAEDESEMVREAAVLGLLVLEDDGQKERLQALVADVEENPRVRAYAILALGVLGDHETLTRIVRPAKGEAIDPRREVRAELRACATYGLGLAKAKGRAALALEVLAGRSEPTPVRGHAGTALGRLGGRAHARDALGQLKDSKDETEVPRTAAAIALGHLVPADDKKLLRTFGTRMQRTKGQFGGVRSELFVALGRIGGERAETLLLEAYERCLADTRRYAERGYAMLGLGLLKTPQARSRLRHALETLDHEKDLGACAIALALAGDRGGVSTLRGHLGASRQQLAAHAMVALGMLGDSGSVPAVREIVMRRRDPLVLAQAGLAMALMAGEGAVDDLRHLWSRCPRAEQKDTLAWAFHLAAGSGARDFLVAVTRDEDRSPEERAYALAALGRMADPAEDPWLNRFGRSFNPYADVPTLDLLARHRDLAFLY